MLRPFEITQPLRYQIANYQTETESVARLSCAVLCAKVKKLLKGYHLFVSHSDPSVFNFYFDVITIVVDRSCGSDEDLTLLLMLAVTLKVYFCELERRFKITCFKRCMSVDIGYLSLGSTRTFT
jgi:hypothetical protein